MNKNSTTVKISKETRVELTKIKGFLEAQTGKRHRVDDAIMFLIENFKKEVNKK
jgi:hypothetical protein